ncbi:uncharacterized protein LOC122245632 [Penaeus japonicus]|uniref:uncharacterized protein LOC122245632 n=1 Tax=Penaeus japonicus TaxID=27405 RepID=UPI001C716069|nr:uncharacterized protein LOC122245632 [Penaeus japonicus]
MTFRSVLLIFCVFVGATGEIPAFDRACLVTQSINTVIREGSFLEFEAFVSDQPVTIVVDQQGRNVTILLTNRDALVTTLGHRESHKLLLDGWKRLKLVLKERLILEEEESGSLLSDDVVRDVFEASVEVSGSALTHNCTTAHRPTWLIAHHRVTTIKLFNKDFSRKSMTLQSRGWFTVRVELGSEYFFLTGSTALRLVLEFQPERMTVTPFALSASYHQLHKPIVCHERHVALYFSPMIASHPLSLTLTPLMPRIEAPDVTAEPGGMLSDVTDEDGLSSGPSGEPLTSSDTRDGADLSSGPSGEPLTSSDTRDGGDLTSGSGDGPEASPEDATPDRDDPRRPTFPAVTILDGEWVVTTPAVLPQGGEERRDFTLAELITLIAMVITLVACMTAVFCIRYYLGYFRISWRRQDTNEAAYLRHASPAPSATAPSATGSCDSDGYITLDDIPGKPLPRPPSRPPFPFPRATEINGRVSVVSTSSGTSFVSSSSRPFSRPSERQDIRAANLTQDSTFSESAAANHPVNLTTTSLPTNHPLSQPTIHPTRRPDSLRVTTEWDHSASTAPFSPRESTAREVEPMYEEILIYVDVEGDRLYANAPFGGRSAEK